MNRESQKRHPIGNEILLDSDIDFGSTDTTSLSLLLVWSSGGRELFDIFLSQGLAAHPANSVFLTGLTKTLSDVPLFPPPRWGPEMGCWIAQHRAQERLCWRCQATKSRTGA